MLEVVDCINNIDLRFSDRSACLASNVIIGFFDSLCISFHWSCLKPAVNLASSHNFMLCSKYIAQPDCQAEGDSE